MTPKEKAEELVNSFYLKFIDRYDKSSMNEYESKHCALIAVDVLMKSHLQDETDNQFYYWQQVKQEIKLV